MSSTAADLAGTGAAADLVVAGPHLAGLGAEADLADTAAALAGAGADLAGSETDTSAGSRMDTGYAAAGHSHSGTVYSAGCCTRGPVPAAPVGWQFVRAI